MSFLELFAVVQTSSPIIVDIHQPEPNDVAGLADVLLGSLGLTGVIVLVAVAAAALFAGVLIWLRSRSSQWTEPDWPR